MFLAIAKEVAEGICKITDPSSGDTTVITTRPVAGSIDSEKGWFAA
jgi:hypothetical protein